jgi:prepilin-type N-terminal cleavage/methylation domain-containing protein
LNVRAFTAGAQRKRRRISSMQNATRTGFTLIELMVAMALTLFVMVILTQAFTTSLDTFSAMKGIGDMQQNLRTAGNVFRNDLSQYHFDGARRLSDMSLSGQPLIVTQPPQAGFLAAWQGSAQVPAAKATATTPYVNEGLDSNGVSSFRAHDHLIYMTVNRRGNRQEHFFTTPLQGTAASLAAFFGKTTRTAYDMDPVNQLPYATLAPPYLSGSTSAFYSSQWAEVIYYLVRTGSSEEPNNPNSQIGTPTFALYRAQFVMVPDGTGVSTLFPRNSGLELSTFNGLSCNPGTAHLTFYSPADAALGNRVIPNLAAFNPNNPRIAEEATLLLPNVISFHVQTMPTGQVGFQDGRYDTTKLGAGGHMNFGLQAIQVTLRVFDSASRQTRQMTIVQNL